jgi:hypothetical protein
MRQIKYYILAVCICGCTHIASLEDGGQMFSGVHMSDQLRMIMTESISEYKTAPCIPDDSKLNNKYIFPIIYDYDMLFPAMPAPLAGRVLTNVTLMAVIERRCPDAYVISDPWGEVLFVTTSKSRAERARSIGNKLKTYEFTNAQISLKSENNDNPCTERYLCYRHASVNGLLNEMINDHGCELRIRSFLPNGKNIMELQLIYTVPIASILWGILVISGSDIEVKNGWIEVYDEQGLKRKSTGGR